MSRAARGKQRSGRSKMKQEERRLVDARITELAERNRQLELEHRLAQAEFEQFDRRTTRELGATPQER